MVSKEEVNCEVEKITKIKPVYEDERGKIIDIVDGEEFVHAGIVTFKPGAIRGNHYHKKTEQINYILKGRLRCLSKDLSKRGSNVKEVVMVAGDMSVNPPLEWHAQEAIEESEMLFFTKKMRGDGEYEDDVFRVSKEEIGDFELELLNIDSHEISDKIKTTEIKEEKSKKVVLTSGYFDPLHVGHIELFKLAKELGDKLIVVVNNDEQVVMKRGKKPFMDQEQRKEVIESIKYVDEVFISIDKRDTTQIETLKLLKPDVFAKGGDRFSYEIPEAAICRELGIKIIDGVGEKRQSSREYYNSN